MISRSLKLGTRRSLLAWAQSSWVARQIEAVNPGLSIELVGIETRGDRIQDIPLSQVTGKEFFVAEIDQVLTTGDVDLTVHSMKDLSLERPHPLQLAAIPRRENPRDVILFGPDVLGKLARGATLKIGTSAPRRIENIPAFLEQALPRLAFGVPKVELVEIRGNVNTRASRLHEPPTAPKHLDGVVLAFAGLIRLWKDEKGRAELSQLLQGVRWMVLPLRECPTAPAQGALAIECRAKDSEALALIRKIHCTETARHVGIERELLREWGGGCHQRFGATSVAHEKLGDLFFIRGRLSDDKSVEELRWTAPAASPAALRAWDGSALRDAVFKTQPLARAESGVTGAVFAAHSRAAEGVRFEKSARIWTSGTKSWFKLALQGLWVEGCAENLGFEGVKSTLTEPVLGLPNAEQWDILTHCNAIDGWSWGRVIPTYRVQPDFGKGEVDSLKQATHVFWSSGSQFEALRGQVSGKARHACGPGKTSEVLMASGVSAVDVFPSVEEWKKWVKI
ncbi:MAG: hydroxymethylbilane synthase [Deltaproteobacteria bacterium]|nr:hydroxymethylbilane synthase [Deltaproteobacteria bacterium]